MTGFWRRWLIVAAGITGLAGLGLVVLAAVGATGALNTIFDVAYLPGEPETSAGDAAALAIGIAGAVMMRSERNIPGEIPTALMPFRVSSTGDTMVSVTMLDASSKVGVWSVATSPSSCCSSHLLSRRGRAALLRIDAIESGQPRRVG